jgi:hypothetical protein
METSEQGPDRDVRSEMKSQAAGNTSEIRLRSFQGNEPPVAVVEGWRRLGRFPAEARGDFRMLLQSALVEPGSAANEKALGQFCTKCRIEEAEALEALGSCSLLFRQAGVLNLDQATFRQDLVSLSEGDSGLADFMLERFEEVKSALRRQIVMDSLTDHGKVITGIDWRVDEVSASDRGADLNTRVVFLTLRYRDGDSRERITFQLVPEAVRELKNFCSRFSM